MNLSGLFKLNARDLFHGLVVAALGTFFAIFFASLSQNGYHQLFDPNFWTGTLDLDVKAVGLFLTTQLLVDHNGNVLGIGSPKSE